MLHRFRRPKLVWLRRWHSPESFRVVMCLVSLCSRASVHGTLPPHQHVHLYVHLRNTSHDRMSRLLQGCLRRKDDGIYGRFNTRMSQDIWGWSNDSGARFRGSFVEGWPRGGCCNYDTCSVAFHKNALINKYGLFPTLTQSRNRVLCNISQLVQLDHTRN